MVGNLTKLQRSYPLSHLYTPKKVGSKKTLKNITLESQKRSWETLGNFKKWGVKVGSSEE